MNRVAEAEHDVASLGLPDTSTMTHARSLYQALFPLATLLILVVNSTCLLAQDARRKPKRSTPPTFSPDEFRGVFFTDLSKQLVGDRPSSTSPSLNQPNANTNPTPASSPPSTNIPLPQVWKQSISSDQLAFLVKNSKLRLDSALATPAKFAGGGYRDAQREFRILATLFGVIEQYPEKIRWQASAPIARQRFHSASTSIRSAASDGLNLAKERLEDIDSLFRGTQLEDPKAPASLDWLSLADREPLMQIMEWNLREKLAPTLSDEKSLTKNQEELAAFASLMDLYAVLIQQPDMPDADDENYSKYAMQMSEHSKRLQSAIQLSNLEAARESLAMLDQSCTRCHGDFK